MRRHELARMIFLSAVVTVVGIVIVLWIDWFPEQGSTAAKDIDTLYDVLLIASVPVFVLVMTVAIYSVWRFRAKRGDLSDGEPIHGNTRLEVIWVTIPFIMVSALAAYGWIVLDDIEAKKANELKVNVIGQQFAWRFEYPEQGLKSTRLVLPVDRPVDFRITTDDVIHSFWVPQFRLKSDAVPGLTTRIRLTPSKVDRYEVVCAELCGLGHSTMRQDVQVVAPAKFRQWVAARKDRATGAGGGGPKEAAADGRAIFTEAGCGACHQLADAGGTGNVGPGLDELAGVAGERVAGTAAADYVLESIVDPGAFTVDDFPAGVMPGDYGDQFTPAELNALVKYLLRVSGGGS